MPRGPKGERQVLLADLVKRSDNPALQDRPEALNVLTRPMISFPHSASIGLRWVGGEWDMLDTYRPSA
jgi:hypothetical protein